MKRALSLALLMVASQPAWLHAQPASAATDARAKSPVANAFEVDIQAPDAVREMLSRHLELLRYRELTDLSENELTRLLVAAHENVQNLVATMGYFSPTIEIDPPEEGSSGAERRIKLRVTPGEPSVVTEVNLRFTGAIETDPAAIVQRQQINIDWPLRRGMRFTQESGMKPNSRPCASSPPCVTPLARSATVWPISTRPSAAQPCRSHSTQGQPIAWGPY